MGYALSGDLGRHENETTAEEFMTLVHHDDVERVRATHNAALDPSEPTPYPAEFRVTRPVKVFGHVDVEGAGRERRVVSIVSTIAGITERKEWAKREHLLRERLRRQADLLNQSYDAIIALRIDGRVQAPPAVFCGRSTSSLTETRSAPARNVKGTTS
jgi:hypothetical protein